MGFREDMRADNEQFDKDTKEVGTPKADSQDHSKRWRNLPTWQIVLLLILFFPVGLYLLWKQKRWSKRTKKVATWATSLAVVASWVLIIIFAPPTVDVTSSLAAVKSDSYQLTGTISPAGSEVTINGVPAKVTGDTFTESVSLKEGDNNLTVVVVSGSKRTEQTFKIHRYTKAEVVAQEKAAAKKAADEAADAAAAAKKKADAAAEQAKQQAAATQPATTKTTPTTSTSTNSKPAPAPAPAAPSITVSQKNAVSKAKDYLSYTAFSHDGLVDQLVYEQFSNADATYGADNSGADWNAQAAKKASDYMSYSSFSRGSLIDQLEYDKFTPDQAAYGATSVGL